jgi:hypothetical protein
MTMPTPPVHQEDRDAAPAGGASQSDRIRKQVVRLLGRPSGLLSVQVRPVGGENYRVNVFVGEGDTSPRIANSFFLTTDPDGRILASSPKILKQYDCGPANLD